MANKGSKGKTGGRRTHARARANAHAVGRSRARVAGTGGFQTGARRTSRLWRYGPLLVWVAFVLFASTDGLIEARRDGSYFGERRLPAVLAEHGRTLDPRELVAVVYREVEAWAPQLDDDVVILALRPQS